MIETHAADLQSQFTTEAFVRPVSEIVEVGVGEKPVLPKLRLFMEAVQKKHPHLLFGYVEGTGGVLYRVYVYMRDHGYTLGAIGYGDFRSTEDDVRTERRDSKDYFVVWSPFIRNMRVKYGSNKFAAHTEIQQSCTEWPDEQVNKALAKALVNVNRIRPFTALNYVSIAGQDMLRRYSGELNAARDMKQRAMSKITQDVYTYWPDLLGLHAAAQLGSGVAHTISPKLSNMIDDYHSQVGETQELLDKATVNMWQVRVTGGGYEVNAVKLNDRMIENPSSQYGSIGFGDVTTYMAEGPSSQYGDELPIDMATKISTLEMIHVSDGGTLYDQKFTLGVGWVSISKQLYYIVDS